MPGFDYARSKATAERLINRFGQAGAIRRAGNATGDDWNPTTGAFTDTACMLVELEFTANEIDGTLIRATDRKVLVSTAGMEAAPTEADKLVIGDNPMDIVAVKPLSPGGLVLLWEVWARG